MLDRDGLATRPVTSMYDLATCARSIGLEPVGLEVGPRQLGQVPLPAIVHVKPEHFLALLKLDEQRALVVDQGSVTREIPRRSFDRRFSGYVVCFKRFLKRDE